MASDGDWGNAPNERARRLIDEFVGATAPMSKLDEFPAVKRWASEKGLTADALSRAGARILNHTTIGYSFAEGIKYRDVTNGHRWNSEGVEWQYLKIVPCTKGAASKVAIVEGETDAAAVTMTWDDVDVAVLPAGAKFVPKYAKDQLSHYREVWLLLDTDDAGDAGAKLLMDHLPAEATVVRGNYGEHKDVCELVANEGTLRLEAVERTKHVFSIRELVTADLGTYEDNHYFDQGVLPIGGIMAVHGGMKSLKSFVVLDLMRALATGTAWASNYGYLRDQPTDVLMFQYEVPPFDFQSRVMSAMADMTVPERESFANHAHVYNIANGEWCRLKASDEFADQVNEAADQAGAKVLVFDPVQRMTGKADINSAAEMDMVLGSFETLQSRGFTVVFVHHNNKANNNTANPYSMSGTQRFGADVDSICSMYRNNACIADGNPEKRKQRNFGFTLRNGAAMGGSVTVVPRQEDPTRVKVTFGPVLVAQDEDDDAEF